MKINKNKYSKEYLFLLDNYLNICCHGCLKKLKLEEIIDNQYKKQNKFYYCSNECYNFF